MEAKDDFTEKRSKFIGYIAPVQTVEEANQFIEKIKKENYDAKHNCYAYILRETKLKRYSDDGEPQGTAGTPILNVLEKEHITDAIIVVTRYFGGVLLGTGGLTRAYTHAAKLALEAAEIKTMSLCSILSVTVDYAFYQKLKFMMQQLQMKILEENFLENVTLLFSVPKENEKNCIDKIFELSDGKYTSEKICEKFAEI